MKLTNVVQMYNHRGVPTSNTRGSVQKNLRMKAIDTHCHLESSEFDADRNDVINRATNNGIVIITSAIEPSTWDVGLELCAQYPTVYLSIGLDPMLYQHVDSTLKKIESNSNHIVAIGETGLDHYRLRDHREREQQQIAFEKLIELASTLSLPIQVHSRSAGGKALDVLCHLDAQDVHMHAFDGKSGLARTASHDYAYYFSIPTSVVRSTQKKKLVKAVALERLLLETDSPVLGSNKEKRNEPTNILIALKEVAAILRREEEELRELILENTCRLYSRIK